MQQQKQLSILKEIPSIPLNCSQLATTKVSHSSFLVISPWSCKTTPWNNTLNNTLLKSVWTFSRTLSRHPCETLDRLVGKYPVALSNRTTYAPLTLLSERNVQSRFPVKRIECCNYGNYNLPSISSGAHWSELTWKGVWIKRSYRNPFFGIRRPRCCLQKKAKKCFFFHCSLNLFSRVDFPLLEPLPAAIAHLRAFLHFSLCGKSWQVVLRKPFCL